MTRKDYVAIAKALRTEREAWSPGADAAGVYLALHNVTRNIADVFAADNPNFDRGRFLSAVEGD